MKYFPFKILALCILLPPILYIVTIQMLESHLENVYQRAIAEIYIGDTEPLFAGSIGIQEAVTQNIDRFLTRRRLPEWGVRVKVTVTTPQNTILYPMVFDSDVNTVAASPIQTAAENYRILNRGLRLRVELAVEHAKPLSVLVLAGYVLAALLAFFFAYRAGSQRALKDETRRQQEIERLQHLEADYRHKLSALNDEQNNLADELVKVKQRFEGEKKRASINEDEMIEEIVKLEQKLDKNLEHQNEQRQVIAELTDKIKQYEAGKLKSKKEKIKEADALQKRFHTLYKNSTVHSKAVDGFAGLTPELQLKAEEVIHQLNADIGLVPVKRKVFGKKNRETVFEVVFAYKGRLYYRILPDQRAEVLSIGTKHTQQKDLAFLNQLINFHLSA